MPVTPQHKAQRPYRGVFPVAPTIFDARGELDLDGQRRCIDFMIDAGSHGLCILANFSEQFVLTDAERETVMHAVLEHVAGRVPVIVTTTHFSSAVCAARSRQAEDAGAAMVMVMPPYHGATFRVPETGIVEFFKRALGCDQHPDHDPGCAGRGHAAVGRSAGAAGQGLRQYPLLQDRGAGRRAKAAQPDRGRRQRYRGAVGRRGGDHADGRSRRRRHRRDDRRRLSRRHPPDHRSLSSPARARRRWPPTSAGCR